MNDFRARTEYQRDEVRQRYNCSREWAATPIGKLLSRFESALVSYWQADGNERSSDRRLRELDGKMRAARNELITAIRREIP